MAISPPTRAIQMTRTVPRRESAPPSTPGNNPHTRHCSWRPSGSPDHPSRRPLAALRRTRSRVLVQVLNCSDYRGLNGISRDESPGNSQLTGVDGTRRDDRAGTRSPRHRGRRALTTGGPTSRGRATSPSPAFTCYGARTRCRPTSLWRLGTAPGWRPRPRASAVAASCATSLTARTTLWVDRS
jgi:hypothetical protein